MRTAMPSNRSRLQQPSHSGSSIIPRIQICGFPHPPPQSIKSHKVIFNHLALTDLGKIGIPTRHEISDWVWWKLNGKTGGTAAVRSPVFPPLQGEWPIFAGIGVPLWEITPSARRPFLRGITIAKRRETFPSPDVAESRWSTWVSRTVRAVGMMAVPAWGSGIFRSRATNARKC